MKDPVRVILVDPNARSRQTLQRQLEAVPEVELIEVSAAYHATIRRIAALGPELTLVVLDENVETALAMIQTVAESHPGVAVVPAGPDHDAAVILQTIRAGAREYLPLPASQLDLLEMVRRVCPRRDPGADTGPPGPRVIAVAGATGGVGCSSLAVNLSTTLAKLSRRDTVLVDFDLLLGSLEEYLAVIPDNSLEMVVRNLEDMDAGLLKRWLPRHPCGLYVLPHPVSMEEAAGIEAHALRSVLELLRETFPTVVIDTSKGLQGTDFLAFETADVILLVLQLSLTGTRNTVRLLQYLRQFEGLEE
jgi:pilus assembly protein CpaE